MERLASNRIVVESIGVLPEFWQESVVFVANLLGIFFENEAEADLLLHEIGGAESYGGRLLPIINLLYAGESGVQQDNLLVLEREPEPALVRYFNETVGLSLPETAILSHPDYLRLGLQLRSASPARATVTPRLLAKLQACPARRMDGYVTDDTLECLASLCNKRNFSSVAGSRRGNNKYLLHQYLLEAGLPIPPTEIAEDPGQIVPGLARLQQAGFDSAVIKAPIGASGIGMEWVEFSNGQGGEAASHMPQSMSVPEHFFLEGPCLLQGWIKAGQQGVKGMYSPSVQLFLNDTQATMYDITEQILGNESVHEGNESPPPYIAEHPEWRAELLRQAGMIGAWLHEQGYRGTASADFILCTLEHGGFVVYACEVNARVTGATYPSVLARHLMPDSLWMLRNVRFPTPISAEALLDEFRKAGQLFTPNAGEAGIFPINFNTGVDALVHKAQLLYLAPAWAGHSSLRLLAETHYGEFARD